MDIYSVERLVKSAYSKPYRRKVTGHYTSMIDPENIYMGMACFEADSSWGTCGAGEFSYLAEHTEGGLGKGGECVQMIEVTASSLAAPVVRAPQTLVTGSRTQMVAYDTIKYDSYETVILPTGTFTWSSSKETVASVSTSGLLTGKAAGASKITVKNAYGSTSFKVTVSDPKKGDIVEINAGRYKITEAGKAVEYLGNRTASAVTVPATVNIGEKKYKVTSIAANAFNGNMALTKVVIGNNVTAIGSKAFSGCTGLRSVTIPAGVKKISQRAFNGCTNLKKLTIRSKQLVLGSVGKNAFSNTGIIIVEVPKVKKATYKMILLKRGLSRKVKIR